MCAESAYSGVSLIPRRHLPQQADELKILLAAYMIERALIEIEHELEQRPAWIRIPVHGILEQLSGGES